ncbi:MAG: hypothetical protein ACR2NA_00375 [Solirubrobacterales bacterium]
MNAIEQLHEIGVRHNERYVRYLIDNIASTKYPSRELMDRTEEAVADTGQMDRYLDVLLERVEMCQYPSLELLDRIRRVTASLP